MLIIFLLFGKKRAIFQHKTLLCDKIRPTSDGLSDSWIYNLSYMLGPRQRQCTKTKYSGAPNPLQEAQRWEISILSTDGLRGHCLDSDLYKVQTRAVLVWEWIRVQHPIQKQWNLMSCFLESAAPNVWDPVRSAVLMKFPLPGVEISQGSIHIWVINIIKCT